MEMPRYEAQTKLKIARSPTLLFRRQPPAQITPHTFLISGHILIRRGLCHRVIFLGGSDVGKNGGSHAKQNQPADDLHEIISLF